MKQDVMDEGNTSVDDILRNVNNIKELRIQQDIQDVMDEGNTSVDDILRNVNNIKELRQYLELNARIDNVFGNEYED